MKKKYVLLIVATIISGVLLVPAIISLHNYNNYNYARKLNTAIEKNDVDAVKKLLGSPFGNVNSATAGYHIYTVFNDVEFKTPLQTACWEGNLEVVKLLIDAGADVNRIVPILSYYSPLMHAVGSDSPEAMDIAKLLIENGADAKYSITYGRDALWEAIGYRHNNFDLIEMVELLETAGANINKEYFGGTILNEACENGAYLLIRYLVGERGLDVNNIDDQGITPLMEVCRRSRENNGDTLRYLLEHGADRTLVSKEGKTAYDYANEDERPDYCEILDEYYPTESSN